MIKGEKKQTSKKNVQIPEGTFCGKNCANCGWSEYDGGANWKTYCNYKKTHVKGDDYCGYWK